MSAFAIQPKSNPSGSFAVAWFDDSDYLWNDKRLSGSLPLSDQWQSPQLQLANPEIGATAILFNPNALAVSQGIRDEWSMFSDIEFLPVKIKGHGTFYIIHVISSIALPNGSRAKIAPPPSGNIVEVESFPHSFKPKFAFFRINQPDGSAASRIGATTKKLYVNHAGAVAVQQVAGAYLNTNEVASA